MAETKVCIACAEQILPNAKLCKHCGTLQDDPRFSHDGQLGPAPSGSQSKSSSWQFLPKVEHDRRAQILDYVTGSGQDFFYRYSAYEYLFLIRKMDAREAQIARMESIGATWDEGPDLARSPDLTSKEAEQFVNASVSTVRMNLARNLLTPPAILAKLSKDKDINVRIGVAANPNTPTDSLVELLSEVGLQTHVFDNLALSPDFIADGLQNTALGNLRYHLLGNWNIDSTDIAYFWGNEDKKRLLVAENLSKDAMLPPQFFGPILDYLSEESSKDGLSSKKWEQILEVLANLVANPGLPDKLFKRIKAEFPGLFSEFGHLADRPRVNW
jgi:hypothetical protein